MLQGIFWGFFFHTTRKLKIKLFEVKKKPEKILRTNLRTSEEKGLFPPFSGFPRYSLHPAKRAKKAENGQKADFQEGRPHNPLRLKPPFVTPPFAAARKGFENAKSIEFFRRRPRGGRQLYLTSPRAPDPFFKASKAPFLTLRVATPSWAPRQAPLEKRDLKNDPKRVGKMLSPISGRL